MLFCSTSPSHLFHINSELAPTTHMASPPDPNMRPPGASAPPIVGVSMVFLKVQTFYVMEGREADVVLVLKNPTPVELLASAKVLSDASPVFKEMLASGPSNNAPRSSANPQRLEMGDDVGSHQMAFLHIALHGGRFNPDYSGSAKEEQTGLSVISNVAILAKKFRVVDSMKEIISPNLLAPFTKRLLRPHLNQDQACNHDAMLAMTAYLLEQDELFAVFTRRMILDHCARLSEVHAVVLQEIPPAAICKSTNPFPFTCEPMLTAQ